MQEPKEIEALAGLVQHAAKKNAYEGYSKYRLLSLRAVISTNYNYLFNVDTGEFARWGHTFADDPEWSPFGPELADIEISEGDCSGACPWCYKSNAIHSGKHMSLATFRHVLDMFPATLTQVALGLTDLDANPDLLDIMAYCRAKDVVPNFTTAGFGCTPEMVEATAGLAGAVAVSVYPHTKERAYETIRAFQQEGLDQVNIHLLYHADNMPFVYSVLDDVRNKVVEPRAVVLLGLKPKGRGSNMHPLPPSEFTKLVKWCMENELPMGFDSCSASKFLKAVDDLGITGKRRDYFNQVAEPCESGLFSIYVSRDAKVYPCSFTEEVSEPIDLMSLEGEKDFLNYVWHSLEMANWRSRLLENGRRCPVYKID